MEGIVGQSELPAGADVLDKSGELVGTLDSSNSQKGYLAVLKGVFFTKGIFLPISSVDRVGVDGIHLNLGKNELQDSRFGTPPDLKDSASEAQPVNDIRNA